MKLALLEEKEMNRATYLGALVHRNSMTYTLWMMWSYVEEGFFEIAMYHHLRYLACRDEYAEIMNSLHWQERNKLSDVYMITDGILSEFRG